MKEQKTSMILSDFFNECIKAGCAIVPVKAYKKYGPDGNASDFFAIKYLAIENYTEVVMEDSPRGWWESEVYIKDPDLYFDTPREALDNWIKNNPGAGAETAEFQLT